MTAWESLEFTENGFKDFLQFWKQKNFEYQTETEKQFATALRSAEDDDIKEDIASTYKQLMKSIATAKDKKLVSKKAEIKSLLTDEILKRYFYKEGLYEYQVKHNPEIIAAINVLNDTNKYTTILKK